MSVVARYQLVAYLFNPVVVAVTNSLSPFLWLFNCHNFAIKKTLNFWCLFPLCDFKQPFLVLLQSRDVHRVFPKAQGHERSKCSWTWYVELLVQYLLLSFTEHMPFICRQLFYLTIYLRHDTALLFKLFIRLVSLSEIHICRKIVYSKKYSLKACLLVA